MASRQCNNCKKSFKTKRKRADRKNVYCSRKCYAKYRSRVYRGENHSLWKGGVTYHNGYKYLFKPEHPNKTKKGYIMEHRLVMENRLGRLLDLKTEVVHHKNGNKLDNRIKNLELMTRANHLNHHKQHN